MTARRAKTNSLAGGTAFEAKLLEHDLMNERERQRIALWIAWNRRAGPLRQLANVRGVVVCAAQALVLDALPNVQLDQYANMRRPRATLAYWSRMTLTLAFGLIFRYFQGGPFSHALSVSWV